MHNTHFILLHFVSFYSIVFLLCFIWELHHMNTNDWNHNQKLQVYWWLVNLIKKDICAFCLVELCMQLCSTRVQKNAALDSQPQVEKVCQLLALGRWYSPGTPASSTTKTGRHDIAEILLKVALKSQKSNQIKFTQVMKLIQA